MNAIDLLKGQHQEVQDLFEQIEQAQDDFEKQALVQELSNNLAAHATIEEKIFYPAAYAGETEELLAKAVEEHLTMKRTLADLLGMIDDEESFDARVFDAKVKVLKEEVEHHVEEEEENLFKVARQELGAERLEELGAEMQELFDEEMLGEPSAAIPDQIQDAAPLQ